MAFSKVAVVLVTLLSFWSYGVLAQLEYLPLQSSLYAKDFVARWNEHNAGAVGDQLQLQLIKNGNFSDGATVSTNTTYFNGYFRASIKLPKGNTAGTVTTFYLSSPGGANSNHSEIDFEFLGNKTDAVTGQIEWHLQTNIFANGIGEREQRITLWFDPSEEYHYYSVIWNHKTVSMYIDEVLIRIFQNYEDEGIAYLNSKPMQVYMSIFDGSHWATRGGLDKIDWSNSPFQVLYTNFILDACQVDPNNVYASPCAHPTHNNWWNHPYFWSLPAERLANMDAIYAERMRYNYCTDYKRFPVPPKECTLPRR
ncbi:hypothetical protein KC19_10G062300 [Ceratodon purpureus]|uniref:Xyloglucan endotransglucosylase/hydrolase n=1 Tax=Ceratodon purpureus TaxID=3225 RepID=A0A8T0GMB9_CERPU|nr:hypothetical protein KC19_10G062300 [Ceratodon purpureus]